jgi:hypothetical protein
MKIRKEMAAGIRIFTRSSSISCFVEWILKSFWLFLLYIIKLVAFYFIGAVFILDQAISWLWRWAETDSGK